MIIKAHICDLKKETSDVVYYGKTTFDERDGRQTGVYIGE
jgi:hypothetical protein